MERRDHHTMNNRLKKIASRIAALALPLLLLPGMKAAAYDAYVYAYDGSCQKTLPVYLPDSVIRLSDGLDTPVSKAADIFYGGDGTLYVADSGNNRVLLYDSAYACIGARTGFTDSGGQEQAFNAPSGLYVDDKENLYIADTENSRIVVLDREGALVRIVGPPSGTGIPDNFVYKPIAVAADAGGRIYAVSRSSNMGVLSFSMSGEFEGFLGVQPVTFSAVDLFWRTFMTQAQRERSVQNIPVDFNDIDIDADGFLFVTSASIDKTSQYNALLAGSTASDYAPVKRLNPSGDDILRRNGFYPPAGDLDVDPSETLDLSVSAFSGVSVNDLGMYSVLDSTKQRIFTYTADGNLLCAFGGVGSSKGQFLSAAALAYHGEDLAVLDAETGLLTLFRPSDYGQLVHEAIGLQNSRRYDEALKKWEEILPLNANLDTVYMDMGKAYLRSGDYDKAMDYFETIGEREYYSKAFAAKRNESLGLILVLVPLALAAFFLAAARLLAKVKALNRADDLHPPAKIGVGKQLQFAFYPLFHPFDGFYALKRYRRGGTAGALILLLAATAAYLISSYLSGYLFSTPVTAQTNQLMDAIRFLFPFLLFAVANYCVTSLFSGEGSFRHICLTVCYAMLPLVLILPPLTVAANLLSLEESMILTLLRGIAYGWTILLIFFGMIAIHGYSFGRNLAATLFTLLGMLILTFLLLLFASLTQKFYAFLYNVVTELSYRL